MEWRKQTRRTRTIVGLGVVVLVPVLITVALKVGGPPGDRGDTGAQFFRIATASGLDMPFAALNALSQFLLVVVVALFAGEAVSGEAAWGTLRYLLVRPVPRSRLLGAKLGVAAVLALVATALVSVSALVAGTAAFGWHPVLTPYFQVLSQAQALGRLALTTLYVAWDMASVVAFALMLSTLTDASFGAVAGGVGLAVVSQIMDGISALHRIRLGLPTHYWDAWHGLLTSPVQFGDMVRGTLVQAGYAAVFLGIAFWWFRRKDVLS